MSKHENGKLLVSKVKIGFLLGLLMWSDMSSIFKLFCQVEPEKGLYYWDEVDHRLLNQVSLWRCSKCSPTQRFPNHPILPSYPHIAFGATSVSDGVIHCQIVRHMLNCHKAELNMGIGLRVYTGPDTPAWVYAEGVLDIIDFPNDPSLRCLK